MANDDESESPEICRERRRRRIELRRAAAAAASARRVRPSEDMASTSGGRDDAALPPEPEPIFATLSIPGRSRVMEDAVSVWTEFARPEITRGRGVHFFSVYDGHGGSHVVELCKERMHVILSEEMGQLRFRRGGEGGEGGGEREAEEEEWWWRRVMKRSFERMDYEAMNTCTRCRTLACNCDAQLVEDSVSGSTAAVAVLTPDHIVVANVGDSRAVLLRGGLSLALSHDHKPDRSDELARIEAAGGCVLFVNGARVEGILAMSRAIGDRDLKPYVISRPEVTFTRRESEDECLIIASDGLWDVLSSDLACTIAAECLNERRVNNPSTAEGPQTARTQREEASPETLYPSRSALTAAILTRLALGRRSSDNISVVVVDMKRR